jgi:alanyl-tRNA synthetase
LISVYETKVSIIIGITKDLEQIIDAKDLVTISSKAVGGKGGGGRKDLAQAGGNKPNKVNTIYEILKDKIDHLP